MVEKILTEQQIRQIARDEYKNFTRLSQYSVGAVQVHTHNNIDSPNLPQHSVAGFVSLPATDPDNGTNIAVGSPVYLNGQTLVLGDSFVNASAPQYSNIYTYPLPVIYGYGTTTAVTMTGSPVAGAVSATLTAPWGGNTAKYGAQFDNKEIRNVNFTNGSAAITWTPGLFDNSGGTGLNVIAESRFKGGYAVPGTTLIFRNDDDGILQLWTRTEPGVFTETWGYVDLTLSLIN